MAPLLTHLHVLLLHGLEVGGVLGQVPVGGTQVVDVPAARLHARAVLRQAGELPRGQRRRLVTQQLCYVLLQKRAPVSSLSSTPPLPAPRIPVPLGSPTERLRGF